MERNFWNNSHKNKEQFNQSRWASSQAVPAQNFDWPYSDDEQRLQQKEKSVRPIALHACFWSLPNLPNQHPLDGTHLVAVRGLIHQQVPTRVRQRGELNWASQLKPSGQQSSQPCHDLSQHWLDKIRKTFSS